MKIIMNIYKIDVFKYLIKNYIVDTFINKSDTKFKYIFIKATMAMFNNLQNMRK
jgi:hypothetical protein